MATDLKFEDLYRIYCAAYVRARIRIDFRFESGDPCGQIAEEAAGMAALAIGTEDGSESGKKLRSESAFSAAMLDAFDTSPRTRQAMVKWVTRGGSAETDCATDVAAVVVRAYASRLGSFTSKDALLEAVRLFVPAREHGDLPAICEEAAKRHNDSLEGR